MTPEPRNCIVLDGWSLTIDQVLAFIDDESTEVLLSEAAADKVFSAQITIDAWLKSGKKAVYGFNTGLGRMKDYLIQESDQTLFQSNILLSHASGIGPYFEESVSRLVLLLRANVMARGHSGVRVDLIRRILTFLEYKLYPMMRQIGSLGIGDLQPMAQVGLCLVGVPDGELRYQGVEGPADVMLRTAGVSPVEFPLARLEALALMSGGTVLLAASLLALSKARRIFDLADAAAALSMEALRGEMDAYDPRVHEVRGIEGQMISACNIRSLLEGSEFTGKRGHLHFETFPRVQDPVSYRSTPQIHGAARDAMAYVESVLARTINASTDNPLFFENDDGSHESLSAGNFHGAGLGYSMDLAAIVLTDMGVLSERRSARLLDPNMSHGLPANLVYDNHGLNTGFALIHASATALVSEMRILASPSSILSIPTKNNQEDHNGMGMTAVRKCLQILEYLKMTLAVEVLCACQGIDLIRRHSPMNPGLGTGRLHARVRREIPPMMSDSFTGRMLPTMVSILADREFLNIVRTRGSE